MLASHIMGIGSTNIEERTFAVSQELETTPIDFKACESVPNAGVLFLLPFLKQTGLFSYKEHYQELRKGYYFLDFIILLLAFMYLCRIKNPEQLKHISPGEFGKIMGIDRIPEAKCLRKKMYNICTQKKADKWKMKLAHQWASKEENEFYYIDGHIQVYTGSMAKLGKKHVSRQKLCLPGMQEFWVNNKEGMPYFFITGQVNEKLIEMLETHIIPKLLNEIPPKYTEQQLQNDPDLPRFTIVFDREAYSPSFFEKLWDKHRIAVITYRKNVKDQWNQNDFQAYNVEVDGNKTRMELEEKPVELDEVPMREIRRKSDDHQTSVITTNKKLSITSVAVYMFSRWTQENFFRYLRQDYDLDKLMFYAVEQIDKDFEVVNPEYNNLNYKLKKIREKINRRMATLYKLKIEDMAESMRYNKLYTESKSFQNIIKMICYRAESSFATLLSSFYCKHANEKRTLVKSIIKTNADIIPDYQNNKLTIKIYSQSSARMNKALGKICRNLNETKTKYPGTNLVMNYKIAT